LTYRSDVSRRLFTSESVTEGHPDKIADQISDTILDALLQQEPSSRVAVEALITTGLVHVAGEVTTKAYAPIATLVRNKILEIGYDSSKKGFDGASCGVSVYAQTAAYGHFGRELPDFTWERIDRVDALGQAVGI
jgi:S-adenosylmethionine synthetase